MRFCLKGLLFRKFIVLHVYLCECMLISFLMTSCNVYNQRTMFRTETSRIPAGVALDAQRAEKNYVIQKNDYLEIFLYSNKGERLKVIIFELLPRY